MSMEMSANMQKQIDYMIFIIANEERQFSERQRTEAWKKLAKMLGIEEADRLAAQNGFRPEDAERVLLEKELAREAERREEVEANRQKNEGEWQSSLGQGGSFISSEVVGDAPKSEGGNIATDTLSGG